jgi:hypothetical protein
MRSIVGINVSKLALGIFVATLAVQPALARQASPTAQVAEQAAAMKVLMQQRQALPPLFRKAYARYPSVPAGTLEAIAYVQTGWRNVQPEEKSASERHMPAAYGVMGLYHGEGFADQVTQGARLTGQGVDTVMRNPEANILAAAALLDQAMRQQGSPAAQREGAETWYAQLLQRYAGFGAGGGNIGAYARESFAYSVLDSMNRAVRENGIAVPGRVIELDRAFTANRLEVLRAPALTMDLDNDSVQPLLQGKNSAPRTVGASTDFSSAIWNPANSNNYNVGGNSTSAVILHTMEGSYASAISWFQNPSAQVSAHYLVRKSDGQVTQMVRETNQAWHARNHNYYTIGIEQEGYASDPGNWSSAMLNSTAAITRSACQRRGINCASAWRGPGYDTYHLVPDSVRVKGHGMLSTNTDRYDPGKYFPWNNFYNMINGGGGSAPPSSPAPSMYWVDTYANAPGYGSPTSTTQTGTLYQGTNYVYCKTWGRQIGSGSSFNHWWLKTDLDVGSSSQWVSAYYLSRWGNDEARDNDGYDLPRCEVLPYGKIGEKWYAIGGVRSVIGNPSLVEADSHVGGRFQQFANGIILWHSRTGAFTVGGKILDRFWATGDEARWGFPMMDEAAAKASPTSGQVGRYQYFEKGLFLWTPATDAHSVYGAILTYFENNGRETTFGYAKGEEQAYGSNGRMQVFEKKTFYWTPERGVWVQ